jgi:hypothetical protein
MTAKNVSLPLPAPLLLLPPNYQYQWNGECPSSQFPHKIMMTNNEQSFSLDMNFNTDDWKTPYFLNYDTLLQEARRWGEHGQLRVLHNDSSVKAERFALSAIDACVTIVECGNSLQVFSLNIDGEIEQSDDTDKMMARLGKALVHHLNLEIIRINYVWNTGWQVDPLFEAYADELMKQEEKHEIKPLNRVVVKLSGPILGGFPIKALWRIVHQHSTFGIEVCYVSFSDLELDTIAPISILVDRIFKCTVAVNANCGMKVIETFVAVERLHVDVNAHEVDLEDFLNIIENRLVKLKCLHIEFERKSEHQPIVTTLEFIHALRYAIYRQKSRIYQLVELQCTLSRWFWASNQEIQDEIVQLEEEWNSRR